MSAGMSSFGLEVAVASMELLPAIVECRLSQITSGQQSHMLALSGYSLPVIACDKRKAFAHGSKATKQSIARHGDRWIASRRLSSRAHSRDPLARNHGAGRAINTIPAAPGARRGA